LNRYLEQAAFLHAGKLPKPKCAGDALSIKTLCNLYLDHQDARAVIGEIKLRHISDQISLLKAFVRFVGPNRLLSDISTVDLQNYRKKLIKAGKSPNTINNRIAAVKAMYSWALDNEIIDHSPRLKAIKKITPPKQEKSTFTVRQIQKLLEYARLIPDLRTQIKKNLRKISYDALAEEKPFVQKIPLEYCYKQEGRLPNGHEMMKAEILTKSNEPILIVTISKRATKIQQEFIKRERTKFSYLSLNQGPHQSSDMVKT